MITAVDEPDLVDVLPFDKVIALGADCRKGDDVVLAGVFVGLELVVEDTCDGLALVEAVELADGVEVTTLACSCKCSVLGAEAQAK